MTPSWRCAGAWAANCARSDGLAGRALRGDRAHVGPRQRPQRARRRRCRRRQPLAAGGRPCRSRNVRGAEAEYASASPARHGFSGDNRRRLVGSSQQLQLCSSTTNPRAGVPVSVTLFGEVRCLAHPTYGPARGRPVTERLAGSPLASANVRADQIVMVSAARARTVGEAVAAAAYRAGAGYVDVNYTTRSCAGPRSRTPATGDRLRAAMARGAHAADGRRRAAVISGRPSTRPPRTTRPGPPGADRRRCRPICGWWWSA